MNTFLPKDGQGEQVTELELMRSTEEEKQDQIREVRNFQSLHDAEFEEAAKSLQAVARARGNVFEQLIESVKVASLGEISDTLRSVWGTYAGSQLPAASEKA